MVDSLEDKRASCFVLRASCIKDFAHFLTQARGSLYEVDTQLEIAARRKYIASEALPRPLMNDVASMLFALSRKLRTA